MAAGAGTCGGLGCTCAVSAAGLAAALRRGSLQAGRLKWVEEVFPPAWTVFCCLFCCGSLGVDGSLATRAG